MSEKKIIKLLEEIVDPCPKCGKRHVFNLKVLLNDEESPAVPLFGGSGERSEVLFSCPVNKKKFTKEVANPPNGEIIGLATEADVQTQTPPTHKSILGDNEFADWVKNSRSIAIDFCKIMLTSSTGAIPIYFAVLKYLGFEKANTSFLLKAGIVPPVFFLIAAIIFVFALRPRYDSIQQIDFATFRKSRLLQLNKLIITGTSIFGIAIALSIIIFFSVFK